MFRFYIRRLILESIEGRKANYKMIFLAGSPGSGKSTLVNMLGLDNHFTTCNIDYFFESMIEEEGMNPNMAQTYQDYAKIKSKKESGEEWSTEDEELFQKLRKVKSREAQLFAASIKNFVHQKGELCEIGANFIVDGTAATPKKILAEKSYYESLGYDCAMVKIQVPVSVSMERNRGRGARGKRQLPDFIVQRSAERTNSPENMQAYDDAFGENFFYVDNVGSYEDFERNISSIQEDLERFLRS